MANIAVQRIRREFKEVIKCEELEPQGARIKLEMNEGNFRELRGQIIGPPDTPYEGGTFDLDIFIPETYPFNPPKVRFRTSLWHPNISSQTGAICLDILKDAWAAAMTLRVVLISLQALLGDPQPDDPQDAVVAGQYKSNPGLFRQTAKFWAHIFAGAPGVPNEEFQRKVEKFEEVAPSVSREKAIQQLSLFDWNIDKAIEEMFP